MLGNETDPHRGIAGNRAHGGVEGDLANAQPTAGGEAGFTLVEMLVVMGIIIILLAVSVPAYNALN